MPIYEYQCHECGSFFEKFIRASECNDRCCDYCASTNIKKIISSVNSNFHAWSETQDKLGIDAMTPWDKNDILEGY
jgi:putative FmdB family regulatory protein